MSNLQYTLRSIPPKIDTALRQRAKKMGKSLNEVAIEAMAKGTGIKPDATFNDMDWFIGNKTLDTSFDEAADWLAEVPKEVR